MDWVLEEPRSLKQTRAKVEMELGKTLSIRALQRVICIVGLVWKRMRRSLRNKRDEEEFRKKKEELIKLKKLADDGQIDLYFEDESSFTLTPCIPYAWQKERIEIPTYRSKRINILGFLGRNGILRGYQVEGSLNGTLFLEILRKFVLTLTKKTVIVLDNSPVHACKLIQEEMERLEKEFPIQFFFLPPYSPELNDIEHLWRKMKYEWIPIQAYLSFENLQYSVEYIFEHYESKYQINFG